MMKQENQIFFLLLCSGILRECRSGLNDGIFVTEDIDTSECRGSIIFRDKNHQEMVTFFASNNSTGRLKPRKVELKGCGCFTLYRRRHFRMEKQKIIVSGHTEVTLRSVGSLERREDCSENRLFSDIPATPQKVIATTAPTTNFSVDYFATATEVKTTKEDISELTEEMDNSAKTVEAIRKTSLLSNADSQEVTEEDLTLLVTLSGKNETENYAPDMNQNITSPEDQSFESLNETILETSDGEDIDTNTLEISSEIIDNATDISLDTSEEVFVEFPHSLSLDDKQIVNETNNISKDEVIVTLIKETDNATDKSLDISDEIFVDLSHSTLLDNKQNVNENNNISDVELIATLIKETKEKQEEREDTIVTVVTSRSAVVSVSETKLLTTKESLTFDAVDSRSDADDETKDTEDNNNIDKIEEIDDEKKTRNKEINSSNTKPQKEILDFMEEVITVNEEPEVNVEEIAKFSTLESKTNLKQTKQYSQLPVPLPYSSPLRAAAENKSTSLHQFTSFIVKFFLVIVYIFLY